MKRACVIGSSDGIGFATAEALLAEGWEVVGVSRGVSALSHPHYTHFVVLMDVSRAQRQRTACFIRLRNLVRDPFSIEGKTPPRLLDEARHSQVIFAVIESVLEAARDDVAGRSEPARQHRARRGRGTHQT